MDHQTREADHILRLALQALQLSDPDATHLPTVELVDALQRVAADWRATHGMRQQMRVVGPVQPSWTIKVDWPDDDWDEDWYAGLGLPLSGVVDAGETWQELGVVGDAHAIADRARHALRHTNARVAVIHANAQPGLIHHD